MRSWAPIAILLAGCGSSSSYALGQATGALVEVAAVVAGAAVNSADPSAPPKFHMLAPPPAKPPSLLQTVECAPGRSYSLFLPKSGATWSCYFENSDGQRYQCRQQGNPAYAPRELDGWCHPGRPAPTALSADRSPPFGPD